MEREKEEYEEYTAASCILSDISLVLTRQTYTRCVRRYMQHHLSNAQKPWTYGPQES